MEAFVLLELVGRGTTGVAHRVRRRSDGRILVVKRIPLSGLDETKRATMQSEASCLQRIRHPSVVGFVDSFIHDNVLHLVMEDAGRDFGMWLKARAAAGCPPTDEEFIWRAVIQVASGLSAMHGARVLHRDIKPDNIFTDERGVVKIGDLGLGRIMSEQSHQATSSVGTPLYFSPEMCEERPYGPKSDVWALGCFLYEMATGRPPFLASNQLALARRILHSPVPPLPARYSPELAFLAVKLLEKDASLRPTAQQILAYSPVRQRLPAINALLIPEEPAAPCASAFSVGEEGEEGGSRLSAGTTRAHWAVPRGHRSLEAVLLALERERAEGDALRRQCAAARSKSASLARELASCRRRLEREQQAVEALSEEREALREALGGRPAPLAEATEEQAQAEQAQGNQAAAAPSAAPEVSAPVSRTEGTASLAALTAPAAALTAPAAALTAPAAALTAPAAALTAPAAALVSDEEAATEQPLCRPRSSSAPPPAAVPPAVAELAASEATAPPAATPAEKRPPSPPQRAAPSLSPGPPRSPLAALVGEAAASVISAYARAAAPLPPPREHDPSEAEEASPPSEGAAASEAAAPAAQLEHSYSAPQPRLLASSPEDPAGGKDLGEQCVPASAPADSRREIVGASSGCASSGSAAGAAPEPPPAPAFTFSLPPARAEPAQSAGDTSDSASLLGSSTPVVIAISHSPRPRDSPDLPRGSAQRKQLRALRRSSHRTDPHRRHTPRSTAVPSSAPPTPTRAPRHADTAQSLPQLPLTALNLPPSDKPHGSAAFGVLYAWRRSDLALPSEVRASAESLAAVPWLHWGGSWLNRHRAACIQSRHAICLLYRAHSQVAVRGLRVRFRNEATLRPLRVPTPFSLPRSEPSPRGRWALLDLPASLTRLREVAEFTLEFDAPHLLDEVFAIGHSPSLVRTAVLHARAEARRAAAAAAAAHGWEVSAPPRSLSSSSTLVSSASAPCCAPLAASQAAWDGARPAAAAGAAAPLLLESESSRLVSPRAQRLRHFALSTAVQPRRRALTTAHAAGPGAGDPADAPPTAAPPSASPLAPWAARSSAEARRDAVAGSAGKFAPVEAPAKANPHFRADSPSTVARRLHFDAALANTSALADAEPCPHPRTDSDAADVSSFEPDICEGNSPIHRVAVVEKDMDVLSSPENSTEQNEEPGSATHVGAVHASGGAEDERRALVSELRRLRAEAKAAELARTSSV